MRRSATLFALLIFSLNFFGFYCYYAFRLVEIRKEARTQLKYLPETALTKFVLTPAKYNEVKRGEDEIQVEGRMYDIARLQVNQDSVVVLALHDAAEDNLISFLQLIVERSASDKKPLPASVMHFFGLMYLPAFFAWECSTPTVVAGNTPYQFLQPIQSINLNTPPPKV